MENEGRNFHMWCKEMPNHTISMFFCVRWSNFINFVKKIIKFWNFKFKIKHFEFISLNFMQFHMQMKLYMDFNVLGLKVWTLVSSVYWWAQIA